MSKENKDDSVEIQTLKTTIKDKDQKIETLQSQIKQLEKTIEASKTTEEKLAQAEKTLERIKLFKADMDRFSDSDYKGGWIRDELTKLMAVKKDTRRTE